VLMTPSYILPRTLRETQLESANPEQTAPRDKATSLL
jgi:hypothetical protein